MKQLLLTSLFVISSVCIAQESTENLNDKYKDAIVIEYGIQTTEPNALWIDIAEKTKELLENVNLFNIHNETLCLMQEFDQIIKSYEANDTVQQYCSIGSAGLIEYPIIMPQLEPNNLRIQFIIYPTYLKSNTAWQLAKQINQHFLDIEWKEDSFMTSMDLFKDLIDTHNTDLKEEVYVWCKSDHWKK